MIRARPRQARKGGGAGVVASIIELDEFLIAGLRPGNLVFKSLDYHVFEAYQEQVL
ncbi:hypothetical protein [Roseibium alexandrii]|uniref:Uncharacterized protein n=1 Tax=Roseibium alexandrii TaxID=388408 RepID=A0A0M6ZZZ3_9HYPH|nr:hypothetical protein [Roseibium alexandrii]CTQ68358.1 hypothetical protein LAX5112_01709 [Roseibium alexandrii]